MSKFSLSAGDNPQYGKLTKDLRASSIMHGTFDLDPAVTIRSGSLVKAEHGLSPDLPNTLYRLTVFSKDQKGQYVVEGEAFKDAFRADQRPRLHRERGPSRARNAPPPVFIQCQPGGHCHRARHEVL